MLEQYIFDSGKEGNTVLILGGVHGDEPSGTKAIQQITKKLTSREILPDRGKIILIDTCNPRATKRNSRYIDHDLNRIMQEGIERPSNSNEHRIAQELMKIISETSDIVLDLHSTSGDSEPFFFAEEESADFARKLGLGDVVSGWSSVGNDVLTGDIETFARKKGKISMTFESGNHHHPSGPRRSFSACLQVLQQSQNIILDNKHLRVKGSSNRYEITDIYVLENGPWEYAQPVTNFQEIKQGEVIGTDGNKQVRAFDDSYIILPKNRVLKPGQEVFFLGYKVN